MITNVLNALPTTGLTIDTFAVGAGQCGTATPSQFGSLEQIAVHFGKHCQVLTDASDAVDLVPGVVASTLSSISVSVDGGPATAVTAISPPLTIHGPATVHWIVPLPAARAGIASHLRNRDRQRRRRQRHDDGLRRLHDQGAADGHRRRRLRECRDDGRRHGVPDLGDARATARRAGRSRSGHCTFADPTAPSTTVTCDDNGTYTLTFTANDGINPPVSGSETLTVQQRRADADADAVAARSVSARLARDGGRLDRRPGHARHGDVLDRLGRRHDEHAVRRDAARLQRAAYVRGGRLVHRAATVTDKDGGTGTDSKTLVVNAPPNVSVGDTGGNEGSAIPLSATVSRSGERPAQVHVDGDSALGRRPGRRLHDLEPGGADPVDHVQRQRRLDDHAHRQRRRQPAGLGERDADGAERRAAPDADVLGRPARGRLDRDGERRDRRSGRDRHVRVHLRVG